MEDKTLSVTHTDLYIRVIETVDIIETIKKYIPLDGGDGSYLEGKCPFDEKCGKSFCVSPTKKTFYCFGCHSRGDVIAFMAKMGNMNKATAARFLDNLQKSNSWSSNVSIQEETDKRL
jgi:DNA primase